MSRWPRLLVVLVGLSALAPRSARADERCPSPDALMRSLRELSEERLDEAEAVILEKADTCLGLPPFLLALGQVRLLRGEYDLAHEAFEQARLLAPDPDLLAMLRHLSAHARRTAALVKSYALYQDPDGLFTVRYPPGKDAVLLPYIREAFPRIAERLGAILGYRPTRPVRIEIYGSPADLAQASSLTEEEIEASGTIALCKYHKLMLTSPRALARGYGWIDTLAHEYVHFILQRQSGTRIPIWLHEAYAKYLETRWRSETSLPMRPSAQHLLREGLARKDLVTFEEMSPSMAKLPTRERTALAFAEVYTVAQYLDTKTGPEGLRRLVALMGEGRSDREALAELLGVPFRTFYKRWYAFVRAHKWRSVPAGVLDLLTFKDDEDPRAELKLIQEKEAEDFTYLGDLLKARDRPKAAVAEYRKAEKRSKGMNPFVQYKLADALLRLDRPEEAYAAVQGPLPHYPEHFLLQLNRARAAVALAKLDEARDALEQALRLNPFDVEVHTLLKTVAQKRGDRALISREEKALATLNGAAGGWQENR